MRFDQKVLRTLTTCRVHALASLLIGNYLLVSSYQACYRSNDLKK
jgi:hypothetical protein